ncbi:SigB/SigF/SigG family RNA polymerase sigma factor [Streptomyces sp. NPDC093109]|uniref:RNA polymerase sigma factor SigF n=1 Tax=Streptomyces sp. NPDC093109 TaxID=3154977 RepID=UPI00344BDC9F
MTNGDGPVRDEGHIPREPRGGHGAPAEPARSPAGIPEQQARPHPEDGLPRTGCDGQTAAAEQAQSERAALMSEQHEIQRNQREEAPGAGGTPGDTPGAAPGSTPGSTPGNASTPGDTPADAPASERANGPGSRHDPHDRSGARAMFIALGKLPDGSPEKAELRNQLVRMHLPLVEHLARRFRNRGEPLDDLTQVATIGLIKSVDRFDPERGVEFSTYATPTVVGEIKRHFRDKGWAVRVPRRLQELRLSLTTATAELSQQHGRSPTVHELAERLGISEEEVLEGLESANAYSTLSLDVPDTDDESPAVADTLGSEDEALEGVEYRESLKPLLEDLPPREKRILLLRFFGNMTQSQIAQEVGISQMHVSRLLARTLAQLRERLLVEE